METLEIILTRRVEVRPSQPCESRDHSAAAEAQQVLRRVDREILRVDHADIDPGIAAGRIDG
jgi:hypothetical protein